MPTSAELNLGKLCHLLGLEATPPPALQLLLFIPFVIMAGCCSGGTCSGSASPAEEITTIPSNNDDCSQDSCCGKSDSSNAEEKPEEECSDKELNENSCCFRDPRENGGVLNQACSLKCESSPISTSLSTMPEVGNCSGGTCCVRKLGGSVKTESSKDDLDKLENEDSSFIIEVDSSLTIPNFERINMTVQGMTCTGCEKTLQKALGSFKAISNIKTNLLMARAEYDLQFTEIYTPEFIEKEIARMTGFTCARILETSDEELELLLDSTGPRLSPSSAPKYVSLRFQGKDRLFLTYNPKAVGARTLISDPYFRHTKLAPPRASVSVASGRVHLHDSILMTLLSVLLTIPVLVLAYGNFPKQEVLYGGISLGLATIIQVVVAGKFYTKALKTLIYSRMVEMDMLVVLSTTTAYIYSVIAYAFLVHGKPLSTGSFFETSTLLVTLIVVGQTVAEYARQRAVESISIESLQTPRAVIVDLKSQTSQEIDTRLLQYGDIFRVLPDQVIATDGTVLEGETEVDESMITGEAATIVKKPGSSVIAGSINHSGTILVRLTKLPSENTIKTISSMVDEAKSSKPKVQEIADAFAGYFTPAIVVVTLLVFVIWIPVGISTRREGKSTACINAMTFAISTLIVSCPCAIGLAVPMVVVIACGVGARHGLILKRSETIEIARKISHVVFDKTGTLTQGHPSVIEEQYFDNSESCASAILGLTANSKHPVSIAITKHLEGKGAQAAHLERITSVPGCGIEGIVNGFKIRAGNQHWLNLSSNSEIQSILSKGLTILCITINDKLVAVFALQDQLRPDAVEVISELKKRGIAISLISGDHARAVDAVADELGISLENVKSHCSPADKASYIKLLHGSSPPSSNTILFLGDGTNDAVALAQASIGLSLSSGTDVASSAADTILISSSLLGILTLIDLSKAFHRRVVFNFCWSAVYNVFAILLAAGAFEGIGRGGVRISPMYAGLGELVSVLPVIGVAVSLRWARF